MCMVRWRISNEYENVYFTYFCCATIVKTAEKTVVVVCTFHVKNDEALEEKMYIAVDDDDDTDEKQNKSRIEKYR